MNTWNNHFSIKIYLQVKVVWMLIILVLKVLKNHLRMMIYVFVFPNDKIYKYVIFHFK
jgi:hypothetical protein